MYLMSSFPLVVCQNPCSSHGVCDTRTKKCSCSTFWMENPFKAHYGSRHSNCGEWVWFVLLIVINLFYRLECTLCCVGGGWSHYNMQLVCLALLLLLHAQVKGTL